MQTSFRIPDFTGVRMTRQLRRMIRDVREQRRSVELVEKRMTVIRILRDTFKFSFPKIGFLIRRDHSSVIHLYRKSLILEVKTEKTVPK